MRALRGNFIPVAFLALWVGASAYTIEALGTMRPSPRIEAAIDMTVTAPTPAPAQTSCVHPEETITAGM